MELIDFIELLVLVAVTICAVTFWAKLRTARKDYADAVQHFLNENREWKQEAERLREKCACYEKACDEEAKEIQELKSEVIVLKNGMRVMEEQAKAKSKSKTTKTAKK